MADVGSLLRRTETWLVLVIVLMGTGLAVTAPTFFTFKNLLDLIDAYAVTAIFACGLLVVLVFGGIDISFAGTAAVTQYLTAMVLTQLGGGWLVAFAVAGGLGLAMGLINAALIWGLGLLAVIVTIANMSILFGLLMFFTRGRSIYDLPAWFEQGGVVAVLGDPAGQQYFLTIAHLSVPLVFLLTWLLLTRTTLGRQLTAHGGNPEAAQRLGCNIMGLHALAYGTMGLFAGIAGIIQAYRVKEVVPNALIGRELDVLAAVVLGGASLLGGIGTVLGTALGIVLLAVLKNGLLLLGVSSYSMGMVTGLVILVSVSATAVAERLRAQRTAGNVA